MKGRVSLFKGWCASVLLCLAGCAVGPDYQRPSLDTPDAWRAEQGWQVGTPQDDQVKGEWWLIYHDPVLNQLQAQALANNQNLAIAQLRLDQSMAQTTVAKSSLFPQLNLQGGSSRFQTSADRPLSAYTVANQQVQQNDYNLGLGVSYEIDLFGRNRRRLEAARAVQAQSLADFENTRLVIGAQLAADYFTLRQLDADLQWLERQFQTQQRLLSLVQVRYEQGFASALDVDTYRIMLNTTQSQQFALRDQRAHFEHAIATLVGQDAVRFEIAALPDPLAFVQLPTVSLVQPSELLQRRPDIASAERSMAAANAQIGIAKSAYFPTLSLSALAGSDANQSPLLFLSHASSLWSVGLSGTQTLFDAGKTSAGVDFAKASYQQSVANYRQTVLAAFEEVQNILSTTGALQLTHRAALQTEQDAKHTYEAIEFKYTVGAASPFELSQAEQNWIAYERQLLQNRTQQLLNSVQLVKALGGGWSVPSEAH